MGDFPPEKGKSVAKCVSTALLCCAACAAILDKMGVEWRPGEIVDAWEEVCGCCPAEARRAICRALAQGRARNEMEVDFCENRVHVVS